MIFQLKKDNNLKIDLSDETDQRFFTEIKEELIENNFILPDLKMISIEEIDEEMQPSVLEFTSNCFPLKLQKLYLKCEKPHMGSAQEYLEALAKGSAQSKLPVCVSSEVSFENMVFEDADVVQNTFNLLSCIRGTVRFTHCELETAGLQLDSIEGGYKINTLIFEDCGELSEWATASRSRKPTKKFKKMVKAFGQGGFSELLKTVSFVRNGIGKGTVKKIFVEAGIGARVIQREEDDE